MSLSICQKCGSPSLIKTPHGRVMLEEFFTEVHISNELGNKLSKPWWKRIFSLHL